MAKATKNNSVIKNIAEASPKAMKDDYSASIVFRQLEGGYEVLDINGEVVNKHGDYGWGGSMYRTNQAIYLNWINSGKTAILSHRVVISGIHLFFIHGSYKNIVALVKEHGLDVLWNSLVNFNWKVYNAEKQTYSWNPEFKVLVGSKAKPKVKPVEVPTVTATVQTIDKPKRNTKGNAISQKIALPAKPAEPKSEVVTDAAAQFNLVMSKFEQYKKFVDDNITEEEFFVLWSKRNK